MKYRLETIPVWDALKENSECPFCLLKEKAENRYIQYYLGNSAMNPETRVDVNKTGFCPDHFSKLLLARSPQHLGLITHTHLQDWMKDLMKSFPFPGRTRSKSGFLKKKTSIMEDFSRKMDKRINDCLICDRIEETLKRYLFTAVYLWQKNEEGFEQTLKNSRGFCLPHMTSLLEMSSEILKSEESESFYNLIKEIQITNLSRLEEEIHWFTQKFKAENQNKPWGKSEDAHYRLIQKLTGKITPH